MEGALIGLDAFDGNRPFKPPTLLDLQGVSVTSAHLSVWCRECRVTYYHEPRNPKRSPPVALVARVMYDHLKDFHPASKWSARAVREGVRWALHRGERDDRRQRARNAPQTTLFPP